MSQDIFVRDFPARVLPRSYRGLGCAAEEPARNPTLGPGQELARAICDKVLASDFLKGSAIQLSPCVFLGCRGVAPPIASAEEGERHTR